MECTCFPMGIPRIGLKRLSEYSCGRDLLGYPTVITEFHHEKMAELGLSPCLSIFLDAKTVHSCPGCLWDCGKALQASSKFPDLAKLWTNISKFPVIPEIWASWRKDGPQRRSRNLCLGEGSDRFLHQGKYDVLFLVVPYPNINCHQLHLFFPCVFHMFWADEIQLKTLAKYTSNQGQLPSP
jgi:hypothetical protein